MDFEHCQCHEACHNTYSNFYKNYLWDFVENLKEKRIPRQDDSIQHFAIFLKKGTYEKEMLVIGENKYSNNNSFIMSTHAEIDALNKLKTKKNVNIKNNKFDLVVIRLSRTGKLGESRPCFHCLEKLENSNVKIRNVYYSSNDTIVKEKFNIMKDSDKTIYCSGYRQNMRKLKRPVDKFVYLNK